MGDASTAALREAPGMRRRGVRWFLAIAFLAAWIPWLGVYLLGGSLGDPLTQLAVAAFVPAIAACVVRRWITRQGFADSGLALHWRASWRYFVAAVTMPWMILSLALAVSAAFGSWSSSELELDASAWAYLAAGPLICVASAPLFWGEEYGWTAYLRDRLVPGRPVATTLCTGAVWGVWHWPLPWLGYFGGDTDAASTLWSMLAWLPLCVLMEFVIGWLWSATGSVWPGAMLHAGVNLVASAGMTTFLGDAVSHTAITYLLCAGLLPIVATIVLTGHTGKPS
jgi:CAAX protease family protein